MPFSVDSTRSPGILRITLTDPWPTLDEQRKWRTTAVKVGLLTPTTRALIDMRAVTILPKYSELNNSVRFGIEDGGWPLRRAYLTTPGFQFAVATQFQMMVPQSITVEAFTDQSTAEHWLMEHKRED